MLLAQGYSKAHELSTVARGILLPVPSSGIFLGLLAIHSFLSSHYLAIFLSARPPTPSHLIAIESQVSNMNFLNLILLISKMVIIIIVIVIVRVNRGNTWHTINVYSYSLVVVLLGATCSLRIYHSWFPQPSKGMCSLSL